MREDLIERLQLKRDVWRGTEFGDDICELLDEAAAALEAAREDAWRSLLVPGLRVYKGDHVVQIDAGKIGLFTERFNGNDDLPRALRVVQDAAIDQARGKGVAE